MEDIISKQKDFLVVEKNLNDKTGAFILEKLKDNKNFIIAGERQSGKTSLLNWMINHLDENKKTILFDFYDEIKLLSDNRNVKRVGFGENADIKGVPQKMDYFPLIEKTLDLEFDVIFADELFGNEMDLIFEVLKDKGGVFTINNSSVENALKFLFLKTIFPENKRINRYIGKRMSECFNYGIYIGEEIEVFEIKFENNELSLSKVKIS